jgi:hypothetical protein
MAKNLVDNWQSGIPRPIHTLIEGRYMCDVISSMRSYANQMKLDWFVKQSKVNIYIVNFV